MRLILTQEVTGLGSPGDIVEVRDGYGRNYLLPQQLAIVATRGAEKQIVHLQRARAAQASATLAQAKDNKAIIEGLSVVITTRVGSGGRLFGSVSAADVAEAINAAGGPKVDRRLVDLGESIKTEGEHPVQVRLHQDVTAHIQVTVTGA
jgi:large subunit ribosomal protein L9